MKHIIFGPPFSGKSTTLALVSTLVAVRAISKVKTLDFEVFGYDREQAYVLKQYLDQKYCERDIVCGGGATEMDKFGADWNKVLILPKYEDYKVYVESKQPYCFTLDKFHKDPYPIYQFFDSKKKEFQLIIEKPWEFVNKYWTVSRGLV